MHIKKRQKISALKLRLIKGNTKLQPDGPAIGQSEIAAVAHYNYLNVAEFPGIPRAKPRSRPHGGAPDESD